MDELGLLTVEQEKQFGKFLDDLKDFSELDGFVWNIIELLDGKLYTSAIGYIDNTLGEKLDPELKPLAAQFVLEVIAEDLDPAAIAETGTNLLNAVLDIPNVSEEYEALMIAGILQGLIALVLNFIDKEEVIIVE